jgi:hypothetical protein
MNGAYSNGNAEYLDKPSFPPRLDVIQSQSI